MNEEQKNINEFDDLFKTNDIKPKQAEPVRTSKYYLSIMYYVLMMFIVSTIIGVVFLSVSSFKKTIDQNEGVIQAIISDGSGMTLLPENIYQIYEDDYQSYAVSVGSYLGYDVIINASNYDGFNYLLDDNNQLDAMHLEEIMTGQKLTWDELNKFSIVFYESSLNPLPSAVTVDATLIDQATVNLTGFSSSLWNFIVYILLTPVLVFVLLKREITADLLVYKNRWFTEFLPAVLIGYALVLVGNFVANFVSMQLGTLLGVMPTTAMNQLSIEQSLQSTGVIFMFISAVFLGPIAEELIFRRSIFKLFKRDWLALIVSAFAFGGVHLLSENTIEGVVVNGSIYIMLGFVFGYLYLRNKKNLAIIISIHMVSNLISVLASILLN